ncbi:MAG: hypothetical protein KY468_19530 [Armatimonadetes bacterium]|nr:hypothetical protein [Armatimonadota bacterium]
MQTSQESLARNAALRVLPLLLCSTAISTAFAQSNPRGGVSGPGGVRHLTGSVVSVDATAGTLTLQAQVGPQAKAVTLAVSAATPVHRFTTVGISGLAVGDQVEVMGIPLNIQAQAIRSGDRPQRPEGAPTGGGPTPPAGMQNGQNPPPNGEANRQRPQPPQQGVQGRRPGGAPSGGVGPQNGSGRGDVNRRPGGGNQQGPPRPPQNGQNPQNPQGGGPDANGAAPQPEGPPVRAHALGAIKSVDAAAGLLALNVAEGLDILVNVPADLKIGKRNAVTLADILTGDLVEVLFSVGRAGNLIALGINVKAPDEVTP